MSFFSLLITYIETGDPYTWKGYFYAGLLFVVILVSSVFNQHYAIGAFISGLQIRAGVIAQVYRKVGNLTMSFFLIVLFTFSLFITFVETDDPYIWKGYLYAVMLFVAMYGTSLLSQKYDIEAFILGMQLRSVVIASVYRKVGMLVGIKCSAFIYMHASFFLCPFSKLRKVNFHRISKYFALQYFTTCFEFKSFRP